MTKETAAIDAALDLYIRGELALIAATDCDECFGKGFVLLAIPVKSRIVRLPGPDKPEYRRKMVPCWCVGQHAAWPAVQKAIQDRIAAAMSAPEIESAETKIQEEVSDVTGNN